jgi:hypothetical protein
VARDAEALWDGKAQRIPPSPEPEHTPAVPDYRRNRVPGGTFFFTVNLLDRRSGLLVTHIDALRAAVRKALGGNAFSHRRVGCAARPHALLVDASPF